MNIVVLGGYGNFGKRIVENLSSISGITIFVAGRSEFKAKSYIATLSTANANLLPLAIDISANNFEAELTRVAPFLVIHTCGPYQNQSHYVPRACINIGAHYIDLADDRNFVCHIGKLDALAKNKRVLVVSGASSVPGLSSAVVDHYQNQFTSIESIKVAIAPGNQAERGAATVKAIFSYTGHRFKGFINGEWQDIYGWMDSSVKDFGGIVGKRYLANVDVPDLELFPKHYQVEKTVTFQAGLELAPLHYGMVGMAFLARNKLVKNWVPLSSLIVKTSNLFLNYGTDKGAMEVNILGKGSNQRLKSVTWTLYAPEGNGPYIPIFSTIILARKLIGNQITTFGAVPCLGLLELNDFMPYFESLNLSVNKQVLER